MLLLLSSDHLRAEPYNLKGGSIMRIVNAVKSLSAPSAPPEDGELSAVLQELGVSASVVSCTAQHKQRLSVPCVRRKRCYGATTSKPLRICAISLR